MNIWTVTSLGMSWARAQIGKRKIAEANRNCFTWNTRFSLLRHVAGGQNLVGIDAHDQVNDLVGSDPAEPMRCIGRNDDHVAGTDVVFAIDADNADGLIADALRSGLLH